MITDLQVQHELLKTALEATDNYLFYEKRAQEAGIATNYDIHNFSYEMARAHDALQSLGVLDQHEPYMEKHVETMLKLHGHKDMTMVDLPYSHVPQSDTGEVEESVSLPTPSAKTLNKIRGYDRYKAVNASVEKKIVEKKEVWDKPSPAKNSTPLTSDQKTKAKARAKAAGRPYPNMVDNIWAARQEETVKSFTNFLKEENEEISEEEIDKIVDELTWEDVVDLYDDVELTYEKEDNKEPDNEDEAELKEDFLDEKLSVQSRLKKRQAFARMRGKRNVARNIKLRRASSIEVLKKRAVVAARRAVYKRFLRGRDKSSLSAAEKDRIEQQVARMKYMQQAIATKMLPKMRSIEQKRLASYRTHKSSAPGGTKASRAPGGTKAPRTKK